MKIVNFAEFLKFAEEMTTKYKFYRIINGKIQAYMIGRDGMILFSEADVDKTIILDIVSKGFIETQLSREEITAMGLE